MSQRGLRIAIDGRPALWPRTGMGTITREILRNIQAADPANFYRAYFDADPGTEHRHLPIAYGGSRNEMLWSNLWLPQRLAQDRIDVYLTILDKEVPLLPTRARIVCMVHDLIPLRFPNDVFRNAAHRLYYNGFIRAAVRRADLILTNSLYSKNEIVALLGVRQDKVCPIPLGVEAPPAIEAQAAEQVLRRHGLSRPYVLALGSTEPRKNNRRVIEAFRQVGAEHCNLQLAIAGAPWRGKQFEPALLEERIRILGYVPDGELSVLMASAEMLVFTSLHEGFGFPVLEAMAHGTPVVTAATAALPEVAGAAALYADPEHAADIAAQMRRLLTEPELRQRLREAGLQRASRFKWGATCDAIARLCTAVATHNAWQGEAVAQ